MRIRRHTDRGHKQYREYRHDALVPLPLNMAPPYLYILERSVIKSRIFITRIASASIGDTSPGITSHGLGRRVNEIAMEASELLLTTKVFRVKRHSKEIRRDRHPKKCQCIHEQFSIFLATTLTVSGSVRFIFLRQLCRALLIC